MPFTGILASAVQPSVSRSDASLTILWLLEIPSFDFRLKPFAQPPAVRQNASRSFGTSEASFWLTCAARPMQPSTIRRPDGAKRHDRAALLTGLRLFWPAAVGRPEGQAKRRVAVWVLLAWSVSKLPHTRRMRQLCLYLP